MLDCCGLGTPVEISVDLSTTDGLAGDEDYPYRRVIGSHMYISTGN